jgi:hypothetical protein
MLKEMYSNKTDKQLKFILGLYSGLLILSVVLPIIFTTISYFLSGKIHFTSIVIFIVIMILSLININYLKKRLNSTGR